MVNHMRSVLLRYVGICVVATCFILLLISGLPSALDTCKCEDQQDRDLQHERFHKSFRFEHTEQKRLAIVVPFRDRFDELLQFAPHIATFLNKQGVPFHIFVVNQNDRFPVQSRIFDKRWLPAGSGQLRLLCDARCGSASAERQFALRVSRSRTAPHIRARVSPEVPLCDLHRWHTVASHGTFRAAERNVEPILGLGSGGR
uniref:Glyco_transf_7N domain-containing protein n=1 Tax=Anopheles funestus TaxID=62324 RepID=A0A4Y0BLR9_ANOFN